MCWTRWLWLKPPNLTWEDVIHQTHVIDTLLQAGAGGVEAMDWAAMLERMYVRWGAARGFKVQTTSRLPGVPVNVLQFVSLLHTKHLLIDVPERMRPQQQHTEAAS